LSIIEEARKRLAASQATAWSSWFFLEFRCQLCFVIIILYSTLNNVCF
jgi:hypothetical protein